MVAIGYMGDPAILPENIREMESNVRDRKPISDLIFDDDWEKMR
jgi:hypothetical protein